MNRKKWTVYIGDWSDSKETHHSVRCFDSSRVASAFCWALANAYVPQKCWMFQGLDGWWTNADLIGKVPPKSISAIYSHFLEEQNKMEKLAAGIELEISVRLGAVEGNMIAYCKKMRCEVVITNISELDALAEEYAEIMECDVGFKPDVRLIINNNNKNWTEK